MRTKLLLVVLASSAVAGCLAASTDDTESSSASGALTTTPASDSTDAGAAASRTIGGQIILPFGPRLDFEMDAPGTGAVFTTPPSSTSVTAKGLASGSGLTVQIQVQNSLANDPTDNSNWIAVGTTQTVANATPGLNSTEPGYGWTFVITPSMVPNWQPGGLLRVRAVPLPHPLQFGSTGIFRSFDQDNLSPTSCLATAYSSGLSWTAAATQCATAFALPTVLASSSLTPADTATPPQFLTAVSQPLPVTISPPNDPNLAVTAAYYAAIGAPTTLTAFKSHYGFATGTIPATSDEVKAVYFNQNDLGLGREMHCKSWVYSFKLHPYYGSRACYVSNYAPQGTSGVTFGDPNSVNLAIAGTSLVATVAMVETTQSFRGAGTPPIVTFIVYDANGNLSDKAQLDHVKASTAVPNNCLTCHAANGSFDSTTNLVTGASFLPFDPETLVFSSTVGYRWVDQADAIRKLNAHVYDAQPAAGVTTQIAGMYGGVDPNNTTATFTSSWIPTGWSVNRESKKLYTEVVKPYCRTCHATAPGIPLDDYVAFTTRSTHGNALGDQIASDVCDPSHRMPQAEQTSRLMWNSGARGYLADALDIRSDCTP